MYYTHNLRASLQEWKSRLYRIPLQDFDNQLNFFIHFLESENIIISIIDEKYVISKQLVDENLDAILKGEKTTYTSMVVQSITLYKYIKYRQANIQPNISILDFHWDLSVNGQDKKSAFIELYIAPIINLLHDYIDKFNSTIFLLEKYKRRTEWFTRESLLLKYSSVEANYEKVLEDDLRLFLFDQGIDYPFSTPSSPSGRADIIGAIDTTDPIIIEVKIIDANKKYGKNRVKEGFTQIQKYANDYNKDVGYLVIYNFDATDVNFNFTASSNSFPPMLIFQNRKFFFVVINLFKGESASKSGKTKSIDITEKDLID